MIETYEIRLSLQECLCKVTQLDGKIKADLIYFAALSDFGLTSKRAKFLFWKFRPFEIDRLPDS